MATYYLDKTGLSYFWSKIKAAISGKQDVLTAGKGISLDSNTVANRGDSVFYGTCETAAGTAAKVVVCDAFTSADLVAGTHITVKFSNANSYNGQATLNINDTGAKNVYYVGSTANAQYMWVAGESVDFVYNGTQWATTNGGLATTTYYGVTKLYTGAGSSSTALALTPSSLYAWANASIAPYYSTSDTYAVGDKVRYGNYLYECNIAITTAEAWNVEHWTVLDPIQTQIDNLESSQFSGDYNDLTNKPTIPTVNNATLTIQKNGTTVQTFTANASSNATANITVPTTTSELTNDAGFTKIITVSSLPSSGIDNNAIYVVVPTS